MTDKKDVLELIEYSTHVEGDDGDSIPSWCYASEISESVEDYSEEDVIKVAKEAGYKTYKVFPGEEYSGGLIICATDCEIEIIKDMIMKFYGVEAEIVEYPEEEKDVLETGYLNETKESKLNEVYPHKDESKKDFISRFMKTTKSEYPDIKQRYAVAMSYWDRKDEILEEDLNTISDTLTIEDKLNESKKDTIELVYPNLEITIQYKVSSEVLYPVDNASPAEYDEEETKIEYSYQADKEDVAEELYYIIAEKPEFKDYSEKELDSYIRKNLDDLADEHYDTLLDKFKDKAKQEAEAEARGELKESKTSLSRIDLDWSGEIEEAKHLASKFNLIVSILRHHGPAGNNPVLRFKGLKQDIIDFLRDVNYAHDSEELESIIAEIVNENLLKEYLDKFTVGQLRTRLEDALEELEDHDDDEKVKFATNTYWVGPHFISIPNLGFIDLEDIFGDEEELEEARGPGRGQKLDRYFRLVSNLQKDKLSKEEIAKLERVKIEVERFEPASDYEKKDKKNLLDQITRLLKENSLEEKIEKHDKLNPVLWNEDKTLKPEVKETLEKIVQKFIECLKEDEIDIKVIDKLIIGSNASYNYTPDSDVDLHIIADSNAVDCPLNLLPIVYNAYRALFNSKYEPKVGEHTVEIYVEMDNTNTISNGVYSLDKGWIKEPVQGNIPEFDESEFEKQFDEWKDRYFDIIKEESNEPLKEKFSTVPEEDLKILETKFDEAGFNVVSKKPYDEFKGSSLIHYQILSKDGEHDEDSFNKKADLMDKILDDFEDITGSPCTFNMGLQIDGFISAGIDCRPIYYEPGEDIAVSKPMKLIFKDGVPADDDTKSNLKSLSDRIGYDVTNFMPVDAKKTNESLDRLSQINKFIEDVYDMRKKSIAEEGEYGMGNLIFKELRNLGYLSTLKELKANLESAEMSLTEDASELYVYEYPQEVEEYMSDFKKLCKANNVKFLGKGKNVIDGDESIIDYYVEGTMENLERLAEDLDYQMHPDYLCPSESFDREDILIESLDLSADNMHLNGDSNEVSSEDVDYHEPKEDDALNAKRNNLEEKKKKTKRDHFHYGLPIFITKPSFWPQKDGALEGAPSELGGTDSSGAGSGGEGGGSASVV